MLQFSSLQHCGGWYVRFLCLSQDFAQHLRCFCFQHFSSWKCANKHGSWSWLHDLTASWLHTSFSASCLTCVRFFLGFGFFKWTVMLEVAKCISATNCAKNRKCVSFTQQLQIQKSLDLKPHWVIRLFSSSVFWPVVNCTGFQLFRRSKLDCFFLPEQQSRYFH